MADRRMFTKKITDGDAFTAMPPTAQALYFHLCMNADDDGFSNNIRIALFNAHATTDDFNTLVSKKFILPFESGVIVIKHWKMHNYIQNDRYHETKYVEEKAQLVLKDNGAYTLDTTCIQSGYNMDTECIPRLGKDSIDKNSIDKVRLDKTRQDKSQKAPKVHSDVYFPDDEYLNDAFKEFVKMRKLIKHPMTDRAIDLAIKKLTGLATHEGLFDHDLAVEIINQSIANSWKGLFPLDGKKNGKEAKGEDILNKWRNA